MSNEYNRPFYEIVCGLNNYKLGTIIESETGQRYKLTKTDNEYRKFSRIDRGLRFLTYENMNKKFRIVEEQEEIDIRKLDFLVEYESFEDYDCRDIGIAITKINEITKTINKMVDLSQQRNDKLKNIEIRLEQLDRNIKEKQ